MATVSSSTSVKSNDPALVTVLLMTVVVLVATLVVGGFWMQSQRSQEAERMQAAQVYKNYLSATRPTPMPDSAESSTRAMAAQEAQETRQFLMSHPSVTPGSGFDRPGVQSTGKTIVQAIDHAKGL